MAKKLFNKKIEFLKKQNFLFGFEVEFIFNYGKISYKDIARKFKALNRNIECEDDGSIEGNNKFAHEATMEVKTPPLTPFKAFSLLEKIFAIIKEYGYTNETCGLHVNFSPVSEKVYRSLNPFSFTQDPLWKTIREDFKRDDNDYCLDFELHSEWSKPMTMLDIWTRAVEDTYSMPYIELDHFHVVNLQHYRNRKTKDARVEVRAFGNTGYHHRIRAVINHSERIIKTFLKHCSSQKISIFKNT